jgi:hypothetical protein
MARQSHDNLRFVRCLWNDGPALADGVSVSTSDSYQVNTKTDSTSGNKVFVDIEDDEVVFKSIASTTSTSGCFAISTAAYSSSNYRMSALSMSSHLY